jgi:hypothetical protein
MNPSYGYGGFAADTADRTRTLFGQVMWYVAAGFGAAHRGLDLPRRPQRLPVLPAHLLPEQLR